ncbi:MAG: MBL fold metallo-hydrolase [Bacteriovoracaceae bacterium]
MKKYFLLLFIVSSALATPTFKAVNHGSFVIESEEKKILVDPVGSYLKYKIFGRPELILITHTHPDHLDEALLKQLKGPKTHIMGPKSVIEKLGYGEIINNGETKKYLKFEIEAIPAYNLTAERKNFHIKGDFNGYVVTAENSRIYISGDTEDIPEMRSLKNIDFAFVCMNLPYTMDIEHAANAVLDFKPAEVFPYHYRNKTPEGVSYSDLTKFKELVETKNPKIKVTLLKWYE